MKIAIHHRKGSFSDRWLEYCNDRQIEYKLVNGYDSNIVSEVGDCNVFMWHFHHSDYRDMMAARKILFSLANSGIKVFPDVPTSWHFDDKVAQKYLLESVQAPLVPSHVFYDKEEAVKWSEKTDYPKVFKLKGGAGASNVRLVRSVAECKRLISKAFGSGFPQFDRVASLKDHWAKYRSGQGSFLDIIKSGVRLFTSTRFSKMYGKEKGYVYFQDFISGNDSDFRIIVIRSQFAYGMRRMNRKNDFRASGSSDFVYDNIPEDMLRVAFQISRRLGMQSVAFDFIRNQDGQPLIVEISYGFGTKGSSQCPGYWTDDLNWHEGDFEPQFWLLDGIVTEQIANMEAKKL